MEGEFTEPVVEHELSPEELGHKFNTTKYFSIFEDYLLEKIKANPSIRFKIVADWVDVNKARAAKALLQDGTKLHVDSVAIRCTREQREEDVNAFMSGVEWIEV